MFRVDTSIGEVEVKFVHVKNPSVLYNATTGCKLFAGNKLLKVGVAYCSKQDNFCRATGRKIALTRAIADFSREDRAAIWKKYFETCKR